MKPSHDPPRHINAVSDKLITRAVWDSIRRCHATDAGEPIDITDIEGPCAIVVTVFPLQHDLFALRLEAEDGFWSEIRFRPGHTSDDRRDRHCPDGL